MRLFLTDAGYQKFQDRQKQGEIGICGRQLEFEYLFGTDEDFMMQVCLPSALYHLFFPVITDVRDIMGRMLIVEFDDNETSIFNEVMEVIEKHPDLRRYRE